MSRMLAALKRLETRQPASRCARMPLDHNLVDVTQVVRVPMPTAAPRASGLSSHVFWQPLELETGSDSSEASASDGTTEPVAIDIAPDAVPIQPAEKEEPQHDTLRNEVLRSLAPTLLRKLRGGLPGAIAVTSVGDSGDASRFVAGLSRAFCREESLRVLAIDAQCGFAEQRDVCELVESLDDSERMHGEIHGTIQATAVEGLSILPHGAGITANSRSFAPLFDKFSRDFDLVLIDGGLASNAATLPLAAACGGTVVLARLGETDTRDARRMVKSLRKADAHLLGCIVVGARMGD